MHNEFIVTMIITVLGSNALWAFFQFLIGRNDEKQDKNDEVLKAIADLSQKVADIEVKEDEREAIRLRVRILRFEDELQEERHHSKDSFDQVLSDISGYNRYCESHPDFKNEQTVQTVEHIKQVYSKRLIKHDFI